MKRRKTIPRPTGKRYSSVAAMKADTRPVRAKATITLPSTLTWTLPADRASFDQMVEQIAFPSLAARNNTDDENERIDRRDDAIAALAAIGITRPDGRIRS